jgi:hypothetical protein
MTTPATCHHPNYDDNRFYSSGQKFGILTLAGVVLLIRKTDAFLNPQFWAEDFWPFFVDANAIGEIIWYQYNGYHLPKAPLILKKRGKGAAPNIAYAAK